MSTQNDEIHAAKSAFDKWTNTEGWDQWDYELQQFSAEDVMDFATQYAASRISELEAENKRLRELIQEAEAWLSFNMRPDAAQITNFRKSLQKALNPPTP